MTTDCQHESSARPQTRGPFATDDQRIASFATAIDALRREVEARVGAADVAHIQRVRAVSSTAEVIGRALIHISFEPVSFSVGVLALSTHKLLELIEIGHTVLHGTYDRVPGGEAFRSEGFRWKAPIDEASWRMAHNVRHHQYTNVAGRDPDLDFGGLRLSERVTRRGLHRLQPVSNLLTWFGFANAINLHATGVLDVYLRHEKPRVLPDRSLRSAVQAHRRFLRKALRYYGREYVLFPALAGPFFWKTLLGNVISDVVRDVYAGATIYCGHVGATDYPPDARAKGRGAFYVMQVEAACDFEVPLPLAILCGGLERQIEHHVFPRLPPNRLREIAPRMQEICEEHGVRYRTGSWPQRLRSVVRTLAQLGGRAADRIGARESDSSASKSRMSPTAVLN